MLYDLFSCCGASDSESEEDWGGLTPPPAAMVGYYDTPPTARIRPLPSSANATCIRDGGGAQSADKRNDSDSIRNTPGSVAAIAARDEPRGMMETTARWFRHTYRYFRSVVESVLALLSIKPYRYLLGGENSFF